MDNKNTTDDELSDAHRPQHEPVIYKAIYLTPVCKDCHPHAEIQWCEDDTGECDECGLSCTKYIPVNP